MTDLKYRTGKLMAAQPINMEISEVVKLIQWNHPVVVILEPGDATRYTLLLLPLRGDGNVSTHLGDFGIEAEDADHYLFVSKLSSYECPGTWVPFGPGQVVDTHHVMELSRNEWSRKLLAWWLTKLNEACR